MRVLRAVVLLVLLVAASLVGAGAAHAAPGVPCGPAARACVDLSANRAWLLRDGAVLAGPVRVSHGRAGFRTPPGTFRVSFLSRDHVSSIYGVRMPYAVFFNGGIALHAGDVRTRSHGCVRMPTSAARAFFDALRPGDVVQVVR
jgi:lipoprotein-anchoring transpeptidase ErfK/SrfK